MEYRNLGKSGLKVSALSLGSWVTFGNQVDLNLAKQMISFAFDQGINFFDNAEGYEKGKSEEIMGNAISSLKLPRDEFIVSSKVYWGGEKPTQKGICRKHIVEGCHAALKRLKVDYLDLYFCHRPEQSTPIEETVWSMHNLIQQGKILYWGTSEWASHEIAVAHVIARQNNLIPPTMEQPQYNILVRNKIEKEYLRIFTELGLGTTIWSPLASGVLSGKYSKGVPKGTRASIKGYEYLHNKFESEEAKENIKKVELLRPIAHNLRMTLSQLAISWCLKNSNVSTVLLGCSQMKQLEENLKSIDLYHKLDTDTMNSIDKIFDTKPEPYKY